MTVIKFDSTQAKLIFPFSQTLNQYRDVTLAKTDLSRLKLAIALPVFFVALFDYLSHVPPFVYVDDLATDDFKTMLDNVLGAEPEEVLATPNDLLGWLSFEPYEESDRYSLKLIQYFGRLMHDYDDPPRVPPLAEAFSKLVPFLPEPSVLDIEFGETRNRISPSALGEIELGLTGRLSLRHPPMRLQHEEELSSHPNVDPADADLLPWP